MSDLKGLELKNLGTRDERAVARAANQVVGRVQYDHGTGAWNEWYLALDSGRWLWLAETQGRYYLSGTLAGGNEKMPAVADAPVTRVVMARENASARGAPEAVRSRPASRRARSHC